MGFCTPDQVKQIAARYLQDSGRGGFQTGTVSSTAPLKIRLNSKIEITDKSLYVTDAAIGLQLSVSQHGTAKLREPLKAGDGVLLLTQPRADGRQMYILLDRIQPYIPTREVSI
ncbi:DUF2577 domain-containing protein [Christensenellaceae bacterium OttesenSCG-928-M15]|nr:DUF2577 domain-containing protein [Christensenellaceae bacterium OttesenSCG-928-M15]